MRSIAASLLFFISLSPLAVVPAPAQSKPGDLDAVLHQMDEASKNFKSAEADFRWDLYERVVKQTTTQNGTIYFLKNGTKLQMGAQILPPATKFIEYKDGVLRLYDPGPNHLTILTAKGNQAQYESFLTLGFGGSGTELAKAWNITMQGAEPMSDGDQTVPTTKLDLVSKDPNVRNTFTHITIWVDPKRAISLKQQFFTPSEDQKTAIYSHIRYNQKVNTAPYAIKPAKNPSIDQH